MRILVIGGSYFLGRVFTMLAAKEHEVTVLNRGTYSMEEFGAICLKADRHDAEALQALPKGEYDVVVDFCAYRQGDIRTLLSGLSIRPKQYLLVSTADVYAKWTGRILTEDAPLEMRRFGGETGEYIRHKVLLEKELSELCKDGRFAATVVRPALLYGPFNYAPRESVYVQTACAGQEWICPVGAPGRFQPVYVKDAAQRILDLTGRREAFGQSYNLAGESVDYERFLTAFAGVSGGVARLRRVDAQDPVLTQPDTFLPFPLLEQETERYDGGKVTALTGREWTPLEEGLEKTWNAFARIYGQA